MKKAFVLLFVVACAKPEAPAPKARPNILVVTLDTTRFDAMGAHTPAFQALAARGLQFRWAYATVPQTLPSHASMFTGLYPAGHGVHENARPLDARHALVAEKLKAAGYGTGAFVSAFALAKRFGLARGFDVYDEPQLPERNAQETTDRALAWLAGQSGEPLFLWVHYYDPHYPYTPPPAHARHGDYRGEVAFMDEQLGRLVAAFDRRGNVAVIVLADHGEGLGDHGEQQHGNLLYQSTMHVPLVIAGPGLSAGTREDVVTTRRVFHTILDWAGLDATHSLRAPASEIVMGEAMKPFLDYGWRPQVMAVEGRMKSIMAGRVEAYDVVTNPAETRDLGATGDLSRPLRAALRDYPLPSTQSAASTEDLDEEERKKLASLGYIASTVKPVIRPDAPRPADMTALYPILDEAAALFVSERYAAAVPLLEKILAADPTNLDAALRLATSHSVLGHDDAAREAFRRAERIAPDSLDVRTYLALHLARGKDWPQAAPLLEEIIAATPSKVPALEALALVRERQGRFPDAIALRRTLYSLRAPSAAELATMGNLAMQVGDTPLAVDSFERARTMQGAAFRHDLELGVVLMAAGRLEEARDALDRVPPSHPGRAMALFKRAQVSVLLREPDADARIAAARAGADDGTRELIAREKLFSK